MFWLRASCLFLPRCIPVGEQNLSFSGTKRLPVSDCLWCEAAPATCSSQLLLAGESQAQRGMKCSPCILAHFVLLYQSNRGWVICKEVYLAYSFGGYKEQTAWCQNLVRACRLSQHDGEASCCIQSRKQGVSRFLLLTDLEGMRELTSSHETSET
jgi:hypothetical protein